MSASWTILPDPAHVRVLQLVSTATTITAIVETVSPTAKCPVCGRLSRRVHSRYVRSVVDVPWHAVPFRLRLHVRRFFCDTPDCSRTIFTERLPGLVAPSARRTERLDTWLRAIGFALGGEEGTRLLRSLGLVASPDTLLRQIRATPDPAVLPPQVVGVDDWCFRRGQRYGAIVVDLERRRVLDLLPDREAGTLATWLKAAPSLDVISRDRGGSFADGARQGAPQALQVADRFHLLKNLVEAFQQVLGREQVALRVAAETVTGTTAATSTRLLTTPERAAREAAQGRREERFAAVRRLRDGGKTIREIALDLHMGPNTIRKLLRTEVCPLPAPRPTHTTVLTSYEPYLRERWNSGEQNGQRLLRELQTRGYRGSQSTLYGLLGRWRTGPRHSGPYARQTAPATPVLPPLRASPRAVSWRLLRPAAERSPAEQTYVAALLEQNSTIATMTTAVTTFFTLLRERQGDALDAWMTDAKASDIPELAGFVEGLRRDLAAVRAAFGLPWSQGQVEGQVNRLKLLKRQMYGRAKLDLLRRRVLGQPTSHSA